MKPLYSLSGRQRKELIERGRPLRIAIPAPDQDSYNEADYFVAAVAGIEREWIVSAEELVLPVAPRHTPAGDTLETLLGSIQSKQDHAPIQVLITVIVAELQDRRVARQATGRTAWAGGPILWPGQ